MTFKKGNKLATARKAYRGGRPKSFTTQVNEALEVIDRELPQIVMQLVDKAKNGDREALIYLIDRRLGKPQQSTDINLLGGETLTASLVANLFTMMAQKRKELELESRKLIENTGTDGDIEGEIT